MSFVGSAGVIGWPVAHSKSPVIHRFWLDALGLDGDYGRFPVAPERLDSALRGLASLGLNGVNVTVPHKQAALALADQADPSATAVGAANILRISDDGKLAAHNSDVDGVLAAGLPHGGHVALVGGGGAARAALAACVRAKVACVTLLARDPARAAPLLELFGVAGRTVALDAATLSDTDMLVNATPLGMTGQPAMPEHLLDAMTALPRHARVFDMVYAPLETPLLARARMLGLTPVDGLTMLIAQAAAAFRLFYGHDAPRDRDADLRALLTK